MSDYLFRRLFLAALLVLPLLTACSSAQYAVMEKFGIHKREILVDRVEDARDSQEEAKQQFASALEELPGPVLAFCRTGNRSGMLYQASQG